MNADIHWDADLIRRYDQPGPRYLSYPTAARFDPRVGSYELHQALRESRRAARPLALHAHIPFCANVCHYCACNKVITKDHGRALPYLERLEREIELIACHLGHAQAVQQLHLGGGTPTFLSHDELRRLVGTLQQRFHVADDAELSIEIDPREADWPTMGLLRELGFNHISVGVQDLDPAVQRAINRMQTFEQTTTVIDAARTLQYHSLNIDLIYGLPLQTPDSFAKTVQLIIGQQPDRISVFAYTHLPERFKAQRRINASDLPEPGDRLEMLRTTLEQLTRAGYRHIGMGHFALPHDDLAMAQEDGSLQRNVLGYTARGDCDVIGLGVSAVSQVGDLYTRNHEDIARYQEALDRGQLPTERGFRCDDDDRRRRYVIQRLMCDFEVDFATFAERFGDRFDQCFADCWPMLAQMERDGLIHLSTEAMTVLPAGRLLVRSLCRLFDRYAFDEQVRPYPLVV
ncbi:oxygen-independent coproporphyrinogen III oxidase [Stutzerimonas urumqiensis]|uniref:oxygen-independent coproporphyrinogen III oxidase n=1 Tax=Stutzerimonas urumqiensis TaxID=638269 RepID=UPI003DA412FC